jgi:hypothetical protein
VRKWLDDIKLGDNHATSPDVTPEVVEYVMMEGNRDKADINGHDKTFQTLQKKVIYPEGFGLGECWHRAMSHFWHCPSQGRQDAATAVSRFALAQRWRP